MSSFTYIVVGAGSAGCVLASRLTENPANTVLLLESGGSDNSVFIKMPTALSIPMNMDKFNWGFESEPEPFLDGRRMPCPRGRVLGGSSSINGMVYVRGHACDFDEWEQLGATGWNYANCLPYFKKAESWIGGGDSYRGGEGPLSVCAGNSMRLNPLYRAFITAGDEAGYGVTEDCNGYRQEGFGAMHMTVRNGERWSTASAYLKPALKRANLTLIKNANVSRVIFQGKRATGVEYTVGDCNFTAVAETEVILSSGSIGSPVILQRSGVGPTEVLRRAGVEVLHDLPGVGANLQDHLEVYFQYRCTKPITLNGKQGLLDKGLIGARWMLFRDGLGATNHVESCAFIRSKAGLKWPDIQYHFLPAAMHYDGKLAFNGHGFQMHVGPNKPKSRGRVYITSNNPHEKPNILFNYLQHSDDRADWRTSIRLSREIIAQPAMDSFRGDAIQPNADIQSDEEIDNWVRANVETAYHPSCTCKMGSDSDQYAVLTPDCRVRGLEALRVVDSSIFPTLTNGNLNAPTIMVAERAADLILGNELLRGADVPVWIDPEWENRQREKPPKRVSLSRESN